MKIAYKSFSAYVNFSGKGMHSFHLWKGSRIQKSLRTTLQLMTCFSVCSGLFYFQWKRVNLGVRSISVSGLFYDGIFIRTMTLWDFFIEFVEFCTVCNVKWGCESKLDSCCADRLAKWLEANSDLNFQVNANKSRSK